MTTIVVTVVAVVVGQSVLRWVGERVIARWQTRLVPSPGAKRVFTLRLDEDTSAKNRVFTVWSREGERVGVIWRHHPGMWLADDAAGRLVGCFDNWPDAAMHLRLLAITSRALDEHEQELRGLSKSETE
jgi:hypothetical protein